MHRILIIKTGSTLPSLLASKGDFEHWILSGMGTSSDQTFVVDVRDGSSLPVYDELSGVVITGSHSMVTDHDDWSERTAAWLAGAVERQMPILRICYGHQLLAYALGGKIGDNPNGHEYGTVEVWLNENAQGDKLLGGLPNPIQVHVSHTQSVVELPAQAKLLASSNMDQHQAFVVGECAWGVQFHPEFDAEVVRVYIHHSQSVLLAEKQHPERLIEQSKDTPYGSEILKRFVQLTNRRET
jgi:GMP synthase (glutamine-hydrolysing)